MELGLLHGERLAHVRVTLAVEAAALAAVHGQLPRLAPRQEAGVAAQGVDVALVRHLVLNLTGGERTSHQQLVIGWNRVSGRAASLLSSTRSFSPGLKRQQRPY